MELYVHIPFCKRKCRYCDFLSFAGKEEFFEPYIDALIEELESYRDVFKAEPAETVFIGGGTPSILPVHLAEKLLDGISSLLEESGSRPCEYTIEANPGTLDREKLKLYKQYGINRLSLGLQSADDAELKLLGRIHDLRDFSESFSLAREAGFDNINIDLMSALPGQTPSSWERSLRYAAEKQPEHISAYSLIIEPGTPFYEIYGEEGAAKGRSGEARLPDVDEERLMYRMTGRILSGYGFERYEISNYSKTGCESKHNLGYWTGKNYIGAGLGASSYICLKNPDGQPVKAVRYKNTESPEDYLMAYGKGGSNTYSGVMPAEAAMGFMRGGCWSDPEFCSESSMLDRRDLIGEYMMLHLRLTRGFAEEEYRMLFGEKPEVLFGSILNKYLEMGLLQKENGYISLTGRGFDVANVIMAEFI